MMRCLSTAGIWEGRGDLVGETRVMLSLVGYLVSLLCYYVVLYCSC